MHQEIGAPIMKDNIRSEPAAAVVPDRPFQSIEDRSCICIRLPIRYDDIPLDSPQTQLVRRAQNIRPTGPMRRSKELDRRSKRVLNRPVARRKAPPGSGYLSATPARDVSWCGCRLNVRQQQLHEQFADAA